eukprot:883789-Pyramimonas_sp.AAC.1
MSPQDACGLIGIPHGSSGSPQGTLQDSSLFLGAPESSPGVSEDPLRGPEDLPPPPPPKGS